MNGNGEVPDYTEVVRFVPLVRGGYIVGVEPTAVRSCVSCGADRYPGDWPHCPHGDGGGFGEEPLEPYFDEHISEKGEWITSRGQRAALMRSGNLEFRKKRTDLLPSTRVYVDMGRR